MFWAQSKNCGNAVTIRRWVATVRARPEPVSRHGASTRRCRVSGGRFSRCVRLVGRLGSRPPPDVEQRDPQPPRDRHFLVTGPGSDAAAGDEFQGGGYRHGLNGHQGDEDEELYRARGERAGTAQQHADERAGQRDQPRRPSLVEPGHERLRSSRACDLHPGVPFEHAQSESGFDLAVAHPQHSQDLPAGQDRGRHRAADQNACHRDHRDPGDRHEAGRQQQYDGGYHARGDRHGRPPPRAVGGDAPAGGAHGHRVHQKQEHGQPDGRAGGTQPLATETTASWTAARSPAVSISLARPVP